MPVYTLISGTATDAYDLSDKLDVFLVDTIGWSRHYTITSGEADRDRVYHNNAGTTGDYGHIYARWRGYSEQLFNYGYSYYSSNGLVYYGLMGNGAVNVNPGTSASGCAYWFMGDLDTVWVITRHSVSGTYFASSTGYCQTYYECPAIDYLPMYVAGQISDSADFSTDRVFMYNSISGTEFFNAQNTSQLVRFGAPQARDNSYFGMPISMVNDAATRYEIRGELPGIRQIWGADFLSEDLITASGIGTYLVIKHGNLTDNTMAYGPY